MDTTKATQHEHATLLLEQALSQMANAVMITDVAGRIVWVNDAFCSICGYDRNEVLGRTPAILKSGRQSAEVYTELWQQIVSGEVWEGSMVEARKDGTLYTVDETVTPLRDADGIITHFVAVQQDASRRERLHEHERYLAQHDPLTGLPNRAMLRDTARKAISNTSRSDQLVALMFVDLDGFKAINDQNGHDLGDQLLAAVAHRLQSALRQSDMIARVGGDEFVALTSDIASPDGAAALAKKLLDSLGSPFVVRGKRLAIRASVGIAMFPSDGGDVDTLINLADQAMYQVKREGGQGYRFFEHSLRPTDSAHRVPAHGRCP